MNIKTILAIIGCWFVAIWLDGLVDVARQNTLARSDMIGLFLNSCPNFLAGFFVPLPLLLLVKKASSFLLSYLVGLLTHEMLQLSLIDGIFDPMDLLASILGVTLCFFVYRTLKGGAKQMHETRKKVA